MRPPAEGWRVHPLSRCFTMDRVRSLTGFAPLDPAHRFTLQVAVIGAKLLGWPEQGLTDAE